MTFPGTRINPATEPLPAEVLDAFKDVVTPPISENVAHHFGARGLQRYHRTGKLVGTAVTIKTRSRNNVAPVHLEAEACVKAQIATGALEQSWIKSALQQAGIA
jgi:regulator of RNase E activity RraA